MVKRRSGACVPPQWVDLDSKESLLKLRARGSSSSGHCGTESVAIAPLGGGEALVEGRYLWWFHSMSSIRTIQPQYCYSDTMH
ncbi:uncharacterized protein LOC134563018 isoform X4 [Prinia subflava]|uniref:uncharacterized protein LOC134563018 isoform X4 n=1 Tax=Prinia subflava TaxID=208062 RepID=UPI002FE36509